MIPNLDYNLLPLPDYTANQGLAGHAPTTDKERALGFKETVWGKRHRVYKCIFCPWDDEQESAVREHLLVRHWTPANPVAQLTREPHALLFDGDGKRITEVPNVQPPAAPGKPVTAALTQALESHLDGMLRNGQLSFNDLLREAEETN